MTTIDDLPNELLDEIFGYLYDTIPCPKGRLVKTVCRRWNRPFINTMHLGSWAEVPDHVNLQLTFPRLVSMGVDFENSKVMQGHATLKELQLDCRYILSSMCDILLYSCILSNCPRLTRLRLVTDFSIFFNDENLEAFMELCPQLTHLDLAIYPDVDIDNEIIDLLNARGADYQGLVNLKNLTINVQSADPEYEVFYYEFDFVAFCSLFQAPFLESLDLHACFDSVQDQSAVLALFPRVRSIHLLEYQNTGIFHGIYEHVTDLKFYSGNVNLLSILNQFPNLVSLDTGSSAVVYDVVHPTKIRNLEVSRMNPALQFWMFPCLQVLNIHVSSQHCNNFIRDLGSNCPQLAQITIRGQYQAFEALDLDNLSLPVLKNLSLTGCTFAVNDSLARFAARHPLCVQKNGKQLTTNVVVSTKIVV